MPDVVFADCGGHALDILLHGPEYNCIVKTFTHVMPSFTGPLPVQSGGGRRPGSLAPAPAPHDCPTWEAFWPRTVLTQNICRRAPRGRPSGLGKY